jgi:hypothetical protein
MTGWTPLWSSIVDSSVWCESKDVKILWITFLAKKDKNGFVAASVPGMAKAAGLTNEECLKALRVLESPDLMSSSKEHEGRRIRKVEHGWIILNHFVYRDLVSKARQRDYNRVKQQEYRERVKAQGKLLKTALNLKPEELGINGNPTVEQLAEARGEYRAAMLKE